MITIMKTIRRVSNVKEEWKGEEKCTYRLFGYANEPED